ncbi:MAG: aldehyde ferredoxin oxidoreductase family protein [Dehalococcoidia bacterium]
MYGYQGHILHIDLTSRTTTIEEIEEGLLPSFIGGIGLGVCLLYQWAPKEVDPLGPANPLIFVGSPLTGTDIAISSHFAVTTKSPLTHFIGESLSSGPLADEMKRTPFDALIITGKADDIAYIFIEDDKVSFHSASHLKGLTTFETEKAIKKELGDEQVRVASIGLAGENRVRYASISSDGRQAGRTGTGAVMGSKNLKAIALRGNRSFKVAHPEELKTLARDLQKRSRGQATEKYRKQGTTANLSMFNQLGALPSYNFRQSTFDGAARISDEALRREHYFKADSATGWEHIYQTRDEEGAPVVGRMEYESLFALGPLCGVDDPNVLIRASSLCDRFGLDTISTGSTVAWAMECCERGILSLKETDGLELRFGNAAALLAAIEKIAHREGLGNLLAEGSRRASQILGRGSEEWAMHVKGLELPGYEPRRLKTLALGLAVSPRGACHNRSMGYEADLSGKTATVKANGRGALAMEGEDFASVLDSMILSKFLRRCFTDFYAEAAHIYELITDYPMSAQELRRVGERINNLKKSFNIREGWTRKDDNLPPRLLKDNLPAGEDNVAILTQEELDSMIDDYYKARGWTKDGSIPQGKLEELGLWKLVQHD